MRDLLLPGPMKDWDKVELIPAIEDALKKLYSGYTLCIATSAEHSDTQDMAEALARLDVLDYFHFFFSSFELNSRKPNINFFISILENTGFDDENTISIGDKYDNDIEPAKKLGLKTIFFNEKKLKGDFSEADRIISNMNELHQAVEEIFITN